VKKFSETWGLVCDCRFEVKKNSSVESSSVVYTHTPTPIFLQANMADYGAQGGYGGDQVQDPNLVVAGEGLVQGGGSDQEAIKQQKIQEVEQDRSLTAEEKTHGRVKIEQEIAPGVDVAAVGYDGHKHHEKKRGEKVRSTKRARKVKKLVRKRSVAFFEGVHLTVTSFKMSTWK